MARCQSCGTALTQSLVDLGMSPLANSYVRPEHVDRPDPVYPLHARVCNECWLVQVDSVVPADEIFTDYAYFSSFSTTFLEHASRYVDAVSRRFGLGPDSQVVEIASNDGYLLQYFVEKGIPALGIEPAENVASVARAKGVPTITAFFGKSLAKQLVADGSRPDLVVSNNVLAHVPDINDFVAGVSILLRGDAVYTVEFPHLLNLIEYAQFDTIYHEHFTYLSLLAVERIFAGHDMSVFDVEEVPTHGGSLRVFACRADARRPPTGAMEKVRAAEKAARLDEPSGYAGFEARVRKVKNELLAFLAEAKNAGARVVAYGAAAKGNTLLNYCGIGPDLIPFVVDKNPAKQNTLLPGSRIPVRSVEALEGQPIDYLLILPWNLRDEIMEQLRELRRAGCKFVTAVPELVES